MDLKAHFAVMKNHVRDLLSLTAKEINDDTSPQELNSILEKAVAKIQDNGQPSTEAIDGFTNSLTALQTKVDELEIPEAVDMSQFVSLESFTALQTELAGLKTSLETSITTVKTDLGKEINTLKAVPANTKKKGDQAIPGVGADDDEGSNEGKYSFNELMNGEVVSKN